jgi:hypothetical protein
MRRRTINKMRGGDRGEMVILTPDNIRTITDDDSLDKNIKESIGRGKKGEMGLEHNSVSKEFIIRGPYIANLHLSNRSDPYIYSILLPIYESGKKFIPGMMHILTENDVTNIKANSDMKLETIFAGDGIIHDPLLNLFIIELNPFDNYDATRVYKETNPITYNKLLEIYNNSRTLIKKPTKDKRSSYQIITDGISQARQGPYRVYERMSKRMSNIFQGTNPHRRVDDGKWMFGEEGKYWRGERE